MTMTASLNLLFAVSEKLEISLQRRDTRLRLRGLELLDAEHKKFETKFEERDAELSLGGTSPNDWPTRERKRVNGVAFIKGTPEYQETPSHRRLPSPDPYDRTVSKRKWEQYLQLGRQR